MVTANAVQSSFPIVMEAAFEILSDFTLSAKSTGTIMIRIKIFTHSSLSSFLIYLLLMGVNGRLDSKA